MGALLALASAVFYGISDFAGGLLSRRVPFATIALAGQIGGLLLSVIAAPILPATEVTVPDLVWGMLSGLGTGVGMLFLFRGLGRGAMSVVVPTSAVGGVALPVLIGTVLLGERPSILSWLGITVAIPGLWLVSRPRSAGASATGASDGLIAGAGIAVQYLALARAGPAAGAWPVAAGRVAAILVILLWIAATRPPWRPPPGPALAAAATGAAAALALMFYLLATRQQFVVVAVVLSSLYPVIPVLLGIIVLRERLSGRQALGLVSAAAAIALLAI